MNTQNRAALIRKIDKKIRAKYRKRSLILVLVALIIGIVLGILICTQTPMFNSRNDASNLDASLHDPDSGEDMDTISNTTALPTTEVIRVTSTPIPAQNTLPEWTETEPTNSATTGTGEGQGSNVSDEPESTDQGSSDQLSYSLGGDGAQAEQTPSSDGTSNMSYDENSGSLDLSTINPIAFGQELTFETDVLQDGTPRYDQTNNNYTRLNITMKMQYYMSPDYYQQKYTGKYVLTGTEAGEAIQITLNSGTTFIPQNAFKIRFVTETGERVKGYQLMDNEISGNLDVSMNVGETRTYYKRFDYDKSYGEIKYIELLYYVNGNEEASYFEVGSPDEAVIYTTLKKGDSSEDVKKMQEKLISLGYLTGEADGTFGSMTENAVIAAQTHYGLTANGEADDTFLKLLYSEQ